MKSVEGRVVDAAEGVVGEVKALQSGQLGHTLDLADLVVTEV